MTQDCSHPHSAADASRRLPKGISITGTGVEPAPGAESASPQHGAVAVGRREDPSVVPTSWSYMFIPHAAAGRLQRWLDSHNAGAESPQPYFIHRSFRYAYRDREREKGVKRTLQPTVSGLVFLQGTVRGLQSFLREYFPQYHLVNDRCQGRPASISDAVMQPFMKVMKAHPQQLTFLREPFEKFAEDHVRLRVLTGPFRGYEGYIVRIDRDRQLVFSFGGYAVALRGVHGEDFEVVE